MTAAGGMRTLRAVTKLSSLDQFVASFAPFVDETSIFVATPAPLETGTERQFVFQLADGTAVLQGRGKVIEDGGAAERDPARSGMRIGFVELTPQSRNVHRALLAAQKPAAPPHPNTVPRGAQRTPSKPPTERPSSWDEEATRPGDPSDLALLVSATVAAPSVADVLPANPLAELGDDALGEFVEYTLQEDDGPLSPEHEADLAAIAVATPIASPIPTPIPIDDRTTVVRLPPPPHPLLGPLVWVAAIAAAAGLAAGYALWGGSVAPSAPASIVPHAPPPAATIAAPAAAPTPAAAAKLAPCRGRVGNAPDGALVRWGDVELGTTPIGDATVPCGAAHVVLSHPRYERLDRDVTATPDAIAVLDAPMKRPPSTLTLRSIPPGADFTVDGASVARGTSEVKVQAFTSVEVVATWPQHEAATRRVYVRGPRDSVVVVLERARPPRRR